MSRPIHWTDDPGVWKGQFEGHGYGSAVSIIFAWLEPGKPGPKLHTHPYSETFVVRRGHAVFTAGGQRIEATAGDIVVMPPGTPHAFANAGATVLEMMDIHASEQIVTIWLEGRSAPPATSVFTAEDANWIS